jgi:AcrR family transcriptional regulator
MADNARIQALKVFARTQKDENRKRLVEAAAAVFEKSGYLGASVEDIARAADVSRQTFYRHYESKLAIALEYFEQQQDDSMLLWQDLNPQNAEDYDAVRGWLDRLFDFYSHRRNALRTFQEMGLMEPGFLEPARGFMQSICEILADRVIGFDTQKQVNELGARCRTDTFLLIFQILEQCNYAAIGLQNMDRAVLVDALTRAVLRFLSEYSHD